MTVTSLSQIDPTNLHEVDAFLEENDFIFSHERRDSVSFLTAASLESNLTFKYVPIKIFSMIGKHLDHEITRFETAQLIVAGALNKDLAEVLPLPQAVKNAIKTEQNTIM